MTDISLMMMLVTTICVLFTVVFPCTLNVMVIIRFWIVI